MLVELYSWYNDYKGNSLLLLFFFFAVIYCLFSKDKRKRTISIYSVIVFTAFVLLINITFVINLMGEEVYWRIFWLFPIIPVISCILAELVNKEGAASNRWLIAAYVSFALIIGGQFVYTKTNFKIAENVYKIPQAAIDISERILEDSTDDPKIIVPSDMVPYIRQYSSQIKLLYGRDVAVGWNRNENLVRVKDALEKAEEDYEVLFTDAARFSCDYVVAGTYINESEEFNFSFFEQVESYYIYKYNQE